VTTAQTTTPAPATTTTTAATKPDLSDVSAEAICAARSNHASLGTFTADPTFGLKSAPIDLSATVSVGKTAAGLVYNDLDFRFTYPQVMQGATPYVSTGYWDVYVTKPKEGVDALEPGASVDVTIIDMGELATPCDGSTNGGALSYSGSGDKGTLTITSRTQTSIEGTLAKKLADGTVANLAFRSPLVDLSTPPKTSTIDTVCCIKQ
jgi:hypothetical protein